MNNKEIINAIRDRKYSKLYHLDRERLSQENPNYLGFLYFIKKSKAEDTKEIFDEILNKFKTESLSYNYLGEIAKQIYHNINEEYISEGFFRLSIELEPNNPKTWWNLFNCIICCSAFLKSIHLDYQARNHEEIIYKLNVSKNYILGTFDYTQDEIKLFLKILQDSHFNSAEIIKHYLAAAYVHCGLYEQGLDILFLLEHVHIKTVEKYYLSGRIDKETALSKLNFWHKVEFLKEDHVAIYNEYLSEYEKGHSGITISALIDKAFRAKNYSDVVEHYDSAPKEHVLLKTGLEPHLYYLLSLLFLKRDMHVPAYTFVLENNSLIDRRNTGLYQAVELLKKIRELDMSFNKNNQNLHSISYDRQFHDAKKLLEDPNLIEHYLYSEMCEQLFVLEKNWNREFYKQALLSIHEDTKSTNAYEDIINACYIGILNERYLEVIDKLAIYHRDNHETVESGHILSVCLAKTGRDNEALIQCIKNIDLMFKSKEFNYIAIDSYLTLSKKLPHVPTHYNHNELRDIANKSILSMFKWDSIITKCQNRTLYKYYPFNINTLDSIINQYFYFPSKEQLNDPIELPMLDRIGDGHTLDQNYRICSFSNNNNSILMWSHYTQNHEGLMIEYQFGTELPIEVGIQDVIYTSNKKRDEEKDEYIFNQFLLTKNHEWQYENEIRMLSYQKDKVFYENYNYPDVDSSKINARIISITLGCKFPEQKINMIANVIKSINDRMECYEQKIQLKRSIISPTNKFTLEYISCELE